MSDAEPKMPQIRIEPEPSPEELVAILTALQPVTVEDMQAIPASHWAQRARLEQLRTPWDESDRGWNR